MPAVARIGDSISCGDILTQGSPDVFANNIPISRVGVDLTTGHGSFSPTVVSLGSPDVFINNLPVDRIGDPIEPHCHNGCHDGTVSTGSPDVFANS